MTDILTLDELRIADAHTKPRNASDLWEYIAAYLNYRIPRVSICKGHQAPFDFINDVFFEKQCNVLAFGPRGGGKTLNVGILAHLNSIHKSFYETAVLGAVKEQSFKCYGYVKSFSDSDNPWFAHDRTFSTMRKTTYRNGSLLQVLTGTMEGTNSAHPICVIADECELTPWPILQEAWCMAQGSKGYQAIQVLLSTRKFASGNMHRLLVEKPKEPSWPYKTYSFCIFEVAEKCTLSDCEQCKKTIRINNGKEETWYDICHEEPDRYPNGKCRSSNGFYTLQDIWTKFTTLDSDTFDAQFRCRRPGRKGLVFPMFATEIHCKRENVEEWRARLHKDRFFTKPEERELEISVTIDMGWTDPLAVLFAAKDKRDNIFYFDCIYARELDLRDFIPMMREKFDKYNIPWKFACRCDARAPREISDLNEMGLVVDSVVLAPDERMALIRKWLNGAYREGHPTICVDSVSCAEILTEFATFKFPTDKQGNPKAESYPEKGPNHLLDCAGYAMEDFGLATGTIRIAIHRAEKTPRPPPKTPTRGDWAKRRRL